MNPTGLPFTAETGFAADERTVSSSVSDTQPRPGGTPPLIAEASRRLQLISQRLRAFLQQKLKQFEAVSLQCESIVLQRDTVIRMQEEVLREKSEWERRRLGQMEELRGEQDQLIEAWQKLEEEQRRMLAQHDSPHLAGSFAAHGGVDSLMPSFAQHAPPSPFETKSSSVYAEPKHYHAAVSGGMSRESALDQFQRLKRDIQNHVKRLQEPPR